MTTPPDSGSGSGRSRAATRRRQTGDGSDPKAATPAQGTGQDEPDVLLDVPKLNVEEISLEVDDLHAQIALEARLADLVQLRVGADVEIARVALEIKGVEAPAQLKVRLDNVLASKKRPKSSQRARWRRRESSRRTRCRTLVRSPESPARSARERRDQAAGRRGNRGLGQRAGASRARAAANRAPGDRRPSGRLRGAREPAAPARARSNVQRHPGDPAARRSVRRL